MKQLQLLTCVVIIVTLVHHIKSSATSNVSRMKKKPIRKSGCYKHLMCNQTTNYPQNEIKKLLRRNKKFFATNKIFGTVIEPIENINEPLSREPFMEEKNFCETRKVTVSPKVAYDVDFQQRFIVNIKGYQQSVSFETCVEKSCFSGVPLPLSYKTTCKQLYNVVRLLYYTDDAKLEHGRFLIPSTCVCTYIKEFL